MSLPWRTDQSAFASSSMTLETQRNSRNCTGYGGPPRLHWLPLTLDMLQGLVVGTRTLDKGCVQYDLLQSRKDPRQFRMVEAWATQADLDLHAGDTPHMTLKRKLGSSAEYASCAAQSTHVDTSYTLVAE